MSVYSQIVRKIESGGNDKAVSSTGAKGPYQFIPSTWAAYGVDGDGDGVKDPFNIADAQPAFDAFTAANARQLSSSLGRDPSYQELYLAHQQGAGGAIRILQNPNATMAELGLGKAASVNGGSGSDTAGSFAQKWFGKYDKMAAGVTGKNLDADGDGTISKAERDAAGMVDGGAVVDTGNGLDVTIRPGGGGGTGSLGSGSVPEAIDTQTKTEAGTAANALNQAVEFSRDYFGRAVLVLLGIVFVAGGVMIFGRGTAAGQMIAKAVPAARALPQA